MANHRKKVSILILFTFLISQNSFEMLSNGGQKTKDQLCFNPAWGLDSHTFTIEILNDDYSKMATTLYVGQIDDNYSISWKNALTEEIEGRKKRGKQTRYYQRTIGWLNYDNTKQLFLALSKDHDIKKVFLKKYPDFLIREDESLLEIIPNFLRGEPAYFTTSNDRFYFVSRSSDYEIFFTNTVDEDLNRLHVLGLKDLDLELPIKSLAITPDNEELLVVTYSEALSEIYNFDILWDESNMELGTPTIIKKPDEQFVYFDCMRDPENKNRYILVGSNKELDENSTAYAFIMNNNEVEGKFLFFRHREESANSIEPVIQFYPGSKLIYFLNPGENNEQTLSYWDGKTIIETEMDLKNIRDFKISPDGENFLVVTYPPEDLYVFSLKK